jgi:protein-L-isoaspartate(D-aspartate) O-methyltransferase
MFGGVFTAIVIVLSCVGNNAGAFETQNQSDPFAAARWQMIEHDLKTRDIDDPVVLRAMEKVQRHRFVDKSQWSDAYEDYPLPLGEGQTISQPYIVALMTQSLRLKKQDTVLEIGTGSGYQAAILAEIVRQVYSVEIIEKLARKADMLLRSLRYKNIKIKTGDGYKGWQEYAPYDAILVTCAVDHIPEPLIQQLKDGGRIILPLGSTTFAQTLVLGTKHGKKLETQTITGVRFVPMTGEGQKHDK